MPLRSISSGNADCTCCLRRASHMKKCSWINRLRCTIKVQACLFSSASPHWNVYPRPSSTFAIQLSSDSPVSNDAFDGPWLSQCHISNQLYPSNIKGTKGKSLVCVVWYNEIILQMGCHRCRYLKRNQAQLSASKFQVAFCCLGFGLMDLWTHFLVEHH